MTTRIFAVILTSLLIAAGCAAQSALAPAPPSATAPVAYTATRQINGLTLNGGTLWAATAGGVLRRDRAGAWRKWTRAAGLPSHEVRRVQLEGGKARAVTPRGVAVLEGGTWRAGAATAAPKTLWRGEAVSGTHELVLGEGKRARHVALPASRGSHISALLPQKTELWAALYGDGVWRFDGAKWTKAAWNIPDAAREITALAGSGGDVWLGTRRDGIWHYDGQSWSRQTGAETDPAEPFDTNIQNMTAFQGQLWSSTLEDGLVRFDGKSWTHIAPPDISTVAARNLVPFGHTLYVRHGNGVVDAWDGAAWKRDAFAALPRRKTFALAADGKRVYAGQWGGWSEWDGKTWTHFLRVPELQGVITISLLPDGDDLWIGTQNRGIAHWSRATGTLTWQDERAGLPDDWITCLAKQGDTVCAGTFVGGLASRGADGRWAAVPELRGQNVTALEPDSDGGLWIATRNGLWHRSREGGLVNVGSKLPALDTELQSLCASADGVWVGARTGIFWVPLSGFAPDFAE